MSVAPFATATGLAATTPSSVSDYLLDPNLTYLNTASLAPAPRAILEQMWRLWQEFESNPVVMGYGRDATSLAGQADLTRGKAATLLGCAADEILITHGTTDAMNIAAQGMNLQSGDRILTTDQEHHGGSMCWSWLQRRRGVGIDVIPIASDDHDTEAIVARFAAAITPATKVISVSHVITSTGLKMPVTAISTLARARGLLCVIDGAQAIGAMAVDVKAIGCHAYAASGHKWLMAPKGTGLLYVSADANTAIAPIQWEDARRVGAESAGLSPFPLIIGLGSAIDILFSRNVAAVEEHNRTLRDYAYAGLRPIPGLQMMGPPPGPHSSYMIACRLPDTIDSREFRIALQSRHGVVVKMNEKRWFNGIRLSPHIFNTRSDIDKALAAIREELNTA